MDNLNTEERKFVDNPANAELFCEPPSSQKRRSNEDQSFASSSSKRVKTSGNKVGISYNISREIRRFDWFIASLFLRNSGITAKIDGITRLPCYTTAAVIYKLFSLNCFMLFALNGLYWFHKKNWQSFLPLT